MTTMNISLPDTLKSFVDAQVREGGYSSSSEYIRELIRQDQVHKAEQRLAALIREGLESGPSRVADEDYWTAKKARLAKQKA